MQELESKIHMSLFSRHIPFNIFSFDNDSIVVLATVRGRKMSINIAYNVSYVDNEYVVSSYDSTKTFDNSSAAISELISMIRKQEIYFSKYTKR